MHIIRSGNYVVTLIIYFVLLLPVCTKTENADTLPLLSLVKNIEESIIIFRQEYNVLNNYSKNKRSDIIDDK